MKRLRFVGMAVLALAILLAAPTTGPAQPMVLKMVCALPQDHVNAKMYHEGYIKELESRLKGRIKFEYYPSGTLLGARDIADGVSRGIADMGSAPAPQVQKVGLLTVFDIPGLLSNVPAKLVSDIQRDLYWHCKPLIDQAQQANLVLLLGFSSGGHNIATVKPANTIDDLKGRKIMVHDSSVGKAIETFGILPINMPSTEVYNSLQSNVIEGCFYHSAGLVSMRLYEVLKYVEVGPFTNPCGPLFINSNTWNKLSPDMKQVFFDVAKELMDKGVEFQVKAEQEARSIMEKNGVKMVNFSKEDLTRWQKAGIAVRQQWAERFKDAGKQVVDFIQARVDNPNLVSK